MKVIARNNGPFVEVGNIKIRQGLLQGREYEVIEWSYSKNSQWVKRTDDFINPREAKFFIKVINAYGQPASFWNNYFLSTEEVRDLKLVELGI